MTWFCAVCLEQPETETRGTKPQRIMPGNGDPFCAFLVRSAQIFRALICTYLGSSAWIGALLFHLGVGVCAFLV
jgi:hypothetical protein